MARVVYECPKCHAGNVVVFEPISERMDLGLSRLVCHACSECWELSENWACFEACPLCQCKAFYVQKAIRPLWMFGGLLVAIALGPKTFWLSLPALWLMDLAVLRFVPNLLVCYRCRMAFQGLDIPSRFKPFQHGIGARYESS